MKPIVCRRWPAGLGGAGRGEGRATGLAEAQVTLTGMATGKNAKFAALLDSFMHGKQHPIQNFNSHY